MKILVIRFSSIGDIVLTSPAVRWLHADGQNEVHFLTKGSFTSLVQHSPYVSKVYSLKDELENTITLLNNEKYDLIVDLHKNIRSKRIVKALRTKSITYNKLNISKWLFVNFKINKLPKKHIVDRYAECIEPQGFNVSQKHVDFHFPTDFRSEIDTWGLIPNEYICVVIGGTYFTKQIPEPILLSLFKRLTLPIVLLGGGQNDMDKADRLVKQSNVPLINLVNKTSLISSADIIKNSNQLITGDTGLMHIASAFDVPIHTLWGNTHPDFGMYAYRKDQSSIYQYQVDVACNPCSKLGSHSCPRGDFRCMLNQNVEQIVKNCSSDVQGQ